MPVSKICFNVYYSKTCFSRICSYMHGIIHEYKQYTYNCTKCLIKLTITWGGFNYTVCAIICELFVFFHGILMVVAEVTEEWQ